MIIENTPGKCWTSPTLSHVGRQTEMGGETIFLLEKRLCLYLLVPPPPPPVSIKLRMTQSNINLMKKMGLYWGNCRRRSQQFEDVSYPSL